MNPISSGDGPSKEVKTGLLSLFAKIETVGALTAQKLEEKRLALSPIFLWRRRKVDRVYELGAA